MQFFLLFIYVLVASNPATLLELALGLKYGYSIIEVFSFASTKMNIISVLFSTPREVRVSIYGDVAPFTQEQANLMKNKFNLNFEMFEGVPQSHPGMVCFFPFHLSTFYFNLY